MSHDVLLNVQDYEDRALKILDKRAADYYRSGSDGQVTLTRNRTSFDEYVIRPRFCRDVSSRSLATTFLGHAVSMPIGVAPTAMQKMAHPDGELGTAKGLSVLYPFLDHHFLTMTCAACEATGAVMILSTISTSSIEEVAAAAPNAHKWFQLYIYKDRKVTKSLISRAERSGFKALVLTIDTPFFGTRHADVRNKFCLPPHLSLANLKSESVPQMSKPGSQASGLNEYATSLFDASLTWKDVRWLKSVTKLPVLVKGVLTAEDAVAAVAHGVSGVIVSNHGGRQLDHVSATVSSSHRFLSYMITSLSSTDPRSVRCRQSRGSEV